MADTILPHELPQALSGHEQASILSLDCFDTLLWRDTHAPVGIFAALPDITEGQRIIAEQRARKAAQASRRSNEVTIEEIYTQLMPNASHGQRAEAVGTELAVEAAHCYAFAPTVELMRAAKQRGMQVVIVSDTYLDRRQLGELIAQSAGDEVAGLIDKIFCSSTFGLSKAQGLFAPVLKKLKCQPIDVLHVGDNRGADFDGARGFGIPALHLVQFAEETKQRLRFEDSCASLIAVARSAIATPQPHRAALAAGESHIACEKQRLGFTTLGPVFHAFDHWLREEATKLAKQHGGTVHWLFLMRDGHLPRAVHAMHDPTNSTAPVEISRFVATASALTNKDTIADLAEQEFALNPSTLARQMLFSEAEIAEIIDEDDPEGSHNQLHAELKSGRRRRMISRRARSFADRFVTHVRSAVNPQPGDTLMLVDLGYNGSAQNRVDAMLREAFDCHVAGRYLLMREMDAPGLDKLGMIDTRHFDSRLLEAMCGNVAVIEQLSTIAAGSTIDFTESGDPIRRESGVKGRQSEVREAVQAGCLAFCQVANASPAVRTAQPDAASHWRNAACAALLRLMFLPTQRELAVIRSFEHDVNLGSERIVPLFDKEIAAEGLLRRGLFYMKGSERMYLPAELAEEDLATRLSLFAQKRFGLALTYQDNVAAAIELPIVHIEGAKVQPGTVNARPTHDGYWVATIPIGVSKYAVAVQFGALFDWVELRSVTASPVSSLGGTALNDEAPIRLSPTFDGIEEHSESLCRCTSNAGLALIMPPASESNEPLIVEIVFRPISTRKLPAADINPAPAHGAAA